MSFISRAGDDGSDLLALNRADYVVRVGYSENVERYVVVLAERSGGAVDDLHLVAENVHVADLVELLCRGIGHGKAYGAGLMTVVRAGDGA